MRTPLYARSLCVWGLLSFLAVAPLAAQDLLTDFEKNVTEFTLDNGMTFIVVEDHEAPVITFYTYADVGSVDEVKGITGMAHMFEHMAFKGTTTLGTQDLEKELEALAAEDAAYDAFRKERQKGPRADPEKLAELEAAFNAATEATKAYLVSNEFDEVVTRNGGVGMNATTWFDATQYFYSLPANKMELWFSLESDRFLNPVLREFYVERDVVMEERRMRTDSSPFGRLLEEFLATAYKAHPYGEPTVGHMSDLQSFTRQEALDFFEKYYPASNLTVALVGAVDPKVAREYAETYFNRLPSRPKPDPVETVEPPQIAERRIVMHEQTQPYLFVGYHKGSVHHPDNAVFQILDDALGNGRTSRMYKRLVEEEKIALQAGLYNDFPDTKYPNMMMALAIPNQGRTPEEAEAVIYDILEDIKANGLTDEELTRAKTRTRATLVRQLTSRTSIASQLTYYEAVTGDWRNLFHRLEQMDAVTNDDIKRVANEVFTLNNRTVAMIKTVEPEAQAAADGAEGSTSGR